MTTKVLTVFGTRPEAIKMAPVVLGLQASIDHESIVCVTAQHRQMLDQVLAIFNIAPDYDLDLMKHKQTLEEITSNILQGMNEVLENASPDLVLVHGDTTTCLAAALAAFYKQIPVGHVEAGLRTGDMYAPFPEEANRSLVGRLAKYHFSPTETAKQNLITENIDSNNIIVTGNTGIDALFLVRSKIESKGLDYWVNIFGDELCQKIIDINRKLVLITGHRRENFGQGFIDLCTAIKRLAEIHPEWDFIYPVHLNPNVREPVNSILNDLNNVVLIEPSNYESFVWLMDQSDLILTDSGGIQEEGPSLGKPVLVMRDVSERPEAIEAGTVKLVGTDIEKIYQGVEHVLLNQDVYDSMSGAINPYGDGKAVPRILDFINSKYSN